MSENFLSLCGFQVLYRGIVSNLLWDVDGISKSEMRLSGALLDLAICVSTLGCRWGFWND